MASQVGKLKDGVNVMEGRLRGEVKTKLEDVRSVLLTALSKAEASIKDIQEDVKKGIVWVKKSNCMKYIRFAILIGLVGMTAAANLKTILGDL